MCVPVRVFRMVVALAVPVEVPVMGPLRRERSVSLGHGVYRELCSVYYQWGDWLWWWVCLMEEGLYGRRELALI